MTTIAKFNSESIMDILEKVLGLCNDQYWEIKAQSLIFAATVLKKFQDMSHILAQKEDVKGGI